MTEGTAIITTPTTTLMKDRVACLTRKSDRRCHHAGEGASCALQEALHHYCHYSMIVIHSAVIFICYDN